MPPTTRRTIRSVVARKTEASPELLARLEARCRRLQAQRRRDWGPIYEAHIATLVAAAALAGQMGAR